MIDILPPIEFLKSADGRRQRVRSDGTNHAPKCILWPDMTEELQTMSDRVNSEQVQLKVYGIGEKNDVDRAVGLMTRLISEERKMGEVE